ncbi:sulfatase-modifying factor protein, partial [Sphingobacteriales bacterium UPWRP_1]
NHLQTLQLRPALPAHMKYIKGGSFEMGDVFGEGYNSEKPVHGVTVDDFYMSAYCVTFEEYDAFCVATGREKPDDRGWGRGKLPVINVTWYDAVEYCNWLSKQQGLTLAYTINGGNVSCNWSASGYRLPTEAEWEYAAREGGKKVRFGNGQNILRTTEANFDAKADYKQLYSEVGEYRGKTVPVDSFKPNALGLYNMSGNVWEWCWDWFGNYQNSPQANPRGAAGGSLRVLRGGSWRINPQSCRVAYRNYGTPNFRVNSCGFRLAFVPQL